MSDFFIPYWDLGLIFITPVLIFYAWSRGTNTSKLLVLISLTVTITILFHVAEWLRWPQFDDVFNGQTTVGAPDVYEDHRPSLLERLAMMGFISAFLWGLIDILAIPVRGVINFLKKHRTKA